MSIETLGHMLCQDPQICRRRNDLKEQLRRTESSNIETDELSNSNNSVSNRMSSLSSSGTDLDVYRPAEGRCSIGEEGRMESSAAHGVIPPRVRDLPTSQPVNAASNKDALIYPPESVAPDLSSVAVFTHQVLRLTWP